jgi:hypothetical protein
LPDEPHGVTDPPAVRLCGGAIAADRGRGAIRV